MFEKLVIKNFQKHSHLEIDLDEKVTTIVGPSDAGKSAVIRSLRWLCQNSPSGIEFLKNGTTEVSVKLCVDGKEIERTKSSASNTYSIDGVDLRAFGQGVPASVVDVLNIDGINFQSQLDPPYWLTLTPGEVSRQLNALIDLSIIDETMKNINRTLNRARVELELAEAKEKKKKEQLEEMQWVKECQMDAAVVKAADKLLTEKKEDLQDLQLLADEYSVHSILAIQARSKLSAVGDVGKQAAYVRKQQQVLDGVAGTLSTVKSLQVKLQFRTVSTEAVDSEKVRLNHYAFSLSTLQKIVNDSRVFSPLVRNKAVADAVFQVDSARSEFLRARGERNLLARFVSMIQDKYSEYDVICTDLVAADKEIEEKTKGQICPVCGKFGI